MSKAMTNREFLSTLDDWQCAIHITTTISLIQQQVNNDSDNIEQYDIMQYVVMVQADFCEWLGKAHRG